MQDSYENTLLREATDAAPVPTPSESLQGDSAHVLYVDDEAALVCIVTQRLERLGYHVTGCTDAAQALQVFRARPHDFDVVVTDLAMPGMSGFELARELLHIQPNVPIIMSSGYIRPEDQATAQRLGIRALILKPDTIKELSQILQDLFAHNRERSKG